MASQPLPMDTENEHYTTTQYSQEQSNKAEGATMVSGSYLWTPPENTVDSFSQEEDSKMSQAMQNWEDVKNKLPPIQAHTPPASPQEQTLPSLAKATGYQTHDSPLFPEQSQSQQERPHSQTPLFENEIEQSPPTTLTNRISSSPEPIEPSPAPRPAQSNIFPTILGVRTPEDARRYYLDRLAEVRSYRKLPLLPSLTSRYPPETDSDRLLRPQHTRAAPAGITKQRSQPKQAKKPKAIAAASPEKVSPPKRRTPKPTRNIDDFVSSAFPSPQTQTKHKRAAPSKKVENDSAKWFELPDYSPPTSSLDSNPKQLKATWHGHALSLADDPDRAHLHADEINLASTLRLHADVYLTNKRKIFQARVQTLRDGKNFTKTAAQGACSIDVNKASQLWEAYDRVGWFDASWFEQFV